MNVNVELNAEVIVEVEAVVVALADLQSEEGVDLLDPGDQEVDQGLSL